MRKRKIPTKVRARMWTGVILSHQAGTSCAAVLELAESGRCTGCPLLDQCNRAPCIAVCALHVETTLRPPVGGVHMMCPYSDRICELVPGTDCACGCALPETCAHITDRFRQIFYRKPSSMCKLSLLRLPQEPVRPVSNLRRPLRQP